jgi:hypothetical protein
MEYVYAKLLRRIRKKKSIHPKVITKTPVMDNCFEIKGGEWKTKERQNGFSSTT